MAIGVIGQGQADLLEVIRARGPPRLLARGLDRRQQQCDQHRDDGDDHQELDQGEAGRRAPGLLRSSTLSMGSAPKTRRLNRVHSPRTGRSIPPGPIRITPRLIRSGAVDPFGTRGRFQTVRSDPITISWSLSSKALADGD